ncbi:LysR family transcriptional regulator [Variovorax ginsengisoli]|uniref:LysR family transcriptional regulator n=1 Tax=Variovorax ginsengisoli TaxID=363844 RepID=A0ABT8S9D0_9BURK|nr:LysR family transcriptional regulator [Variovorax ginsengisoli]MDN8614866.1 LysR family transcriptional regulator [Variovorax ginsengisoli]MDO1534036.1 LysR family transcriptional regulator [Variovorax ginsengisoli]
MNFDTSLLQAFVAVHQANGFTRAAEQLHLTQSAVSHQIRRLEEMVGRPLFRRTTRRLSLTADGEDLLRHAKRILQAQDALAQHFRSSPIEGTVRFGVPESFMSERLPRLLHQFSRSCPKVRLEVSVGLTLDLATMVRERELDLAVVVSVSGTTEGTLLRRLPLVWAAAEGFERPNGASLPLAYSPLPCVCHRIGVAALDSAEIAWHGAFSSHSLEDLRTVALSGLAVAIFTSDNLRPGMVVLNEGQGFPALPMLDFTLAYSEINAEERGFAVVELGRLIEEARWE